MTDIEELALEIAEAAVPQWDIYRHAKLRPLAEKIAPILTRHLSADARGCTRWKTGCNGSEGGKDGRENQLAAAMRRVRLRGNRRDLRNSSYAVAAYADSSRNRAGPMPRLRLP